MRRCVVRDVDRVAAAKISFVCIYAGLSIAADFGGFSYFYGPWTIGIITIVVAALLINIRELTDDTWKLWLIAFAETFSE